MSSYENGRSPKLHSIALVRSIGIVLVVANHSGVTLGGQHLNGGLNLLLLASGVSFAQLAFGSGTDHTLRLMWRFAIRLVVPSIALALATAVILREFDLWELGLVSNWISASRVSLFPIWYTQVIVQMFVALAALFFVFDLVPTIERRPLRTTVLALLVSVALATVSKGFWDTEVDLRDKLPHLLAWNFIAGWVIWALGREARSQRMRVVVSVLLVVASLAMFLLVGLVNGSSRAVMLPPAILLLVWYPYVRVHPRLRHVVLLISGSTLFIFLFHYYAFALLTDGLRLLGFDSEELSPWIGFVFGVTLPVLLWVATTAFRRSWSPRSSGTSPVLGRDRGPSVLGNAKVSTRSR